MSKQQQRNGRSVGTGHRQSDLAVMDAQEYKQKRRLKRILDAHDKVEERREMAKLSLANGNIDKNGVNMAILGAVQEFIRECFNLLRAHAEETDGRDRYWQGDPEAPLGRVEMKRDENDPIIFVGLKDILRAQDVYQESWQVRKSRRHAGPELESESATHTVPERVSMRAFLLAKSFLAEERDMDLSFDGEVDTDAPVYKP